MKPFDAVFVSTLFTLAAAGTHAGCRAPADPGGPAPKATIAEGPTPAPGDHSSKETTMKPVTVINRLVVKSGKMDEFIDAQRTFAASLMKTTDGLIGGRMYRGADGTTAILVSQFASIGAQEEIRQLDAFKEHVSRLKPLIESASPSLYEEAYTAGDFK